MDKEVVKELIQHDCNPTSIRNELELILKNGKNRTKVLNDYLDLKKKLGGRGASQKVAHSLLKTI